MQNNEENEFLDLQENYTLPEKKEVAIDLKTNRSIDMDSLTPLEMIQLTAKEHGIQLKEFKLKYGRFDTNCRRPGCYGRGYKGWNGKIPVPCVCLFNPENRNDGKTPINRKVNRDFEKIAQNQVRYALKNRAEIYGLKHSYKDIWVSKNGAEFVWSNVKGKWDFRRVGSVIDPIKQYLEEKE